MDISVIIPTVGRPALLDRALDALARQGIAPERYEVVVVVDGTDAPSAELLARRRGDMACLAWEETGARRGPAAARNRAWRRCRAPVIAMTDDDCEPEPGWLASFLAAFERDHDLGVAVGRTVTDRGRLTPFSHYVENQEGKTHQTCNIAYRRTLLEQLGGFDEEYPFSLEDTDLFCRAQAVARTAFVPEAMVRHPPRENSIGALAASARRFEGDFVFHRKHPALYRQRHAGYGPLRAVLWTVGVKHVAKQLLVHSPWLHRQLRVYLRYLAAMMLFECVLWTTAPRYWWRHARRSRPGNLGAGGAS